MDRWGGGECRRERIQGVGQANTFFFVKPFGNFTGDRPGSANSGRSLNQQQHNISPINSLTLTSLQKASETH